jgi:hypothetical protein
MVRLGASVRQPIAPFTRKRTAGVKTNARTVKDALQLSIRQRPRVVVPNAAHHIQKGDQDRYNINKIVIRGATRHRICASDSIE